MTGAALREAVVDVLALTLAGALLVVLGGDEDRVAAALAVARERCAR